jgi:PHP family Zn ribbon phosphoesterase
MVVGIVLFAGIFGTAIAGIIAKSILKYREMELSAQARQPFLPPNADEMATLVQSIKLLKQENDHLRNQQAELTTRLQQLEQLALPAHTLPPIEQSSKPHVSTE